MLREAGVIVEKFNEDREISKEEVTETMQIIQDRIKKLKLSK